MYLSGTIVEYTCYTGHFMYPQKSNTISCNKAGKWIGAIGRCYPSMKIDKMNFLVMSIFL